MSNIFDDILISAREIVQDDYIKSRLPQLTDVMTKLIEKHENENDSLNESERYTLITLTVLIQNNPNLQ